MPLAADTPNSMAWWSIFLFGLAGSAAVETLRVVIAYERGRIPARYKKWGFWSVRSLLGAFAGLLAVAYDVQSGILAMHIGAATPAIIENFATKPPLPTETGDATTGEQR
jgi:hypothetical protein